MNTNNNDTKMPEHTFRQQHQLCVVLTNAASRLFNG